VTRNAEISLSVLSAQRASLFSEWKKREREREREKTNSNVKSKRDKFSASSYIPLNEKMIDDRRLQCTRGIDFFHFIF